MKLEFDGAVSGVALRTPSPIWLGKPARASSVWKSQPGFGAPAAFDGDPQTRWGAAQNAHSAWLGVDLGQATRIGQGNAEAGGTQ
ncbi:MAG: discoidin domain-containing protein [Verrucomicrobiota bacterium]